MADRIKFNIPGKPAYLTMVRLAIGSVADTMGFDFEDLRKARFSGRSGSISRFEINDEGRVTAAYINRRAG